MLYFLEWGAYELKLSISDIKVTLLNTENIQWMNTIFFIKNVNTSRHAIMECIVDPALSETSLVTIVVCDVCLMMYNAVSYGIYVIVNIFQIKMESILSFVSWANVISQQELELCTLKSHIDILDSFQYFRKKPWIC